MNLSAKVALRIANRSVDDLDVVGAFFLEGGQRPLSHESCVLCFNVFTKTVGRDGGRWLAHTEDPVYAGRLPEG